MSTDASGRRFGAITLVLFLMQTAAMSASDQSLDDLDFYDELKALDKTCWHGKLTYMKSDYEIVARFEYDPNEPTVAGGRGVFTMWSRFPKGGPKIANDRFTQRHRLHRLHKGQTVEWRFRTTDKLWAGIAIGDLILRKSGEVRNIGSNPPHGVYGWFGHVHIAKTGTALIVSLEDLVYGFGIVPGFYTDPSNGTKLPPIAVNLTAPDDPDVIRRVLDAGERKTVPAKETR